MDKKQAVLEQTRMKMEMARASVLSTTRPRSIATSESPSPTAKLSVVEAPARKTASAFSVASRKKKARTNAGSPFGRPAKEAVGARSECAEQLTAREGDMLARVHPRTHTRDILYSLPVGASIPKFSFPVKRRLDDIPERGERVQDVSGSEDARDFGFACASASAPDESDGLASDSEAVGLGDSLRPEDRRAQFSTRSHFAQSVTESDGPTVGKRVRDADSDGEVVGRSPFISLCPAPVVVRKRKPARRIFLNAVSLASLCVAAFLVYAGGAPVTGESSWRAESPAVTVGADHSRAREVRAGLPRVEEEADEVVLVPAAKPPVRVLASVQVSEIPVSQRSSDVESEPAPDASTDTDEQADGAFVLPEFEDRIPILPEELDGICSDESVFSEIGKEVKSARDTLVEYIAAVRTGNSVVSRSEMERIADAVFFYSAKYNLPVGLVVGIIQTESNFRPGAVSSADARGLMQVMWKYHGPRLQKVGLKTKECLHDVEMGIEAGCIVLSSYIDAEKSITRALGRYYGALTQQYVSTVKTYWEIYELVASGMMDNSEWKDSVARTRRAWNNLFARSSTSNSAMKSGDGPSPKPSAPRVPRSPAVSSAPVSVSARVPAPAPAASTFVYGGNSLVLRKTDGTTVRWSDESRR